MLSPDKFFEGVYFTILSVSSEVAPDVVQTAASVGSSISWPTAFAVVGSVVTIVTGVCAYLLSVKKIKNNKSETQTSSSESAVRSEILQQKLENLEEKFSEHEKRDTRDFETVNKKIDKLTDILMKILSDDRL